MMNRMNRHWDDIPKEEILRLAQQATPESYGADWMTERSNFAFADNILGKQLALRFDDGLQLDYHFAEKTKLLYAKDGAAPVETFYRALNAVGYEDVVFVHHYVDGDPLPTCVELVLDFASGYAVAIIGQLAVDTRARNVVHTIHFGRMEGITPSAEIAPPAYTNDLIGKAILWQMPSFTAKPPIKHIYLSPRYYGIFMTRDDSCYMTCDPADYIKIRDDLYLVSCVEHNRSGIQLTFLINTTELKDVVGHFGVSAGNEVGSDTASISCTVMTGRQGTFAPLETL